MEGRREEETNQCSDRQMIKWEDGWMNKWMGWMNLFLSLPR